MLEVNNFNAIRISLASPDQIQRLVMRFQTELNETLFPRWKLANGHRKADA